MITNPTISGTRVLPVYLSDNADIPTPNLLISSTMTGKADGGAILVDATNPFIVNDANTVNVGDVIYVDSFSVAATITEVISASQIRINDPIADIGIDYKIYQQSPITGTMNSGCFLFVGACGAGKSVHCLTIGNDDVVFNNIPSGTILPIKIKKVFADTTGSAILAIW